MDNVERRSPSRWVGHLRDWRQNRAMIALVILPQIGIVLTSILAVAYARGDPVPCGVGGGCNDLMFSKYARVFGISTPLFGLFTYCSLSALTFLFVFRSSRLSLVAILIMSFMGTIVSFLLIAIATFHIRTMCSWCLASALTMTSIFGVASSIQSVANGAHENYSPRLTKIVMFVGLACAAIACVFIAGRPPSQTVLINVTSLAKMTAEQLAPDASVSFGPKTSSDLVIVFTDFECSACTFALPKLIDLQTQSGEFRLVVRHFPFERGSDSYLASIFAELVRHDLPEAPFLKQVCMASEQETPILFTCVSVANKMGMNGVDLLRETKTFEVGETIVDKDLELGLSLGITGTPVIILIRRGVQPRVSSLTELQYMFTGK